MLLKPSLAVPYDEALELGAAISRTSMTCGDRTTPGADRNLDFATVARRRRPPLLRDRFTLSVSCSKLLTLSFRSVTLRAPFRLLA